MELQFAFVNVSAKRPYLVVEAVNDTGEENYVIYIPLNDDMQFFLMYMSFDGRVTDEDRDMIFDVALHME